MVPLPGDKRSDEEILADVVEALRWDGRVESTAIQPLVSEGMVRLTGTVPTYTGRSAAVEQARMTPGVRGRRGVGGAGSEGIVMGRRAG